MNEIRKEIHGEFVTAWIKLVLAALLAAGSFELALRVIG